MGGSVKVRVEAITQITAMMQVQEAEAFTSTTAMGRHIDDKCLQAHKSGIM